MVVAPLGAAQGPIAPLPTSFVEWAVVECGHGMPTGVHASCSHSFRCVLHSTQVIPQFGTHCRSLGATTCCPTTGRPLQSEPWTCPIQGRGPKRLWPTAWWPWRGHLLQMGTSVGVGMGGTGQPGWGPGLAAVEATPCLGTVGPRLRPDPCSPCPCPCMAPAVTSLAHTEGWCTCTLAGVSWACGGWWVGPGPGLPPCGAHATLPPPTWCAWRCVMRRGLGSVSLVVWAVHQHGKVPGAVSWWVYRRHPTCLCGPWGWGPGPPWALVPTVPVPVPVPVQVPVPVSLLAPAPAGASWCHQTHVPPTGWTPPGGCPHGCAAALGRMPRRACPLRLVCLTLWLGWPRQAVWQVLLWLTTQACTCSTSKQGGQASDPSVD